MLYREAGQFKTDYRADQAIFPIRQDRILVVALILFAFLVVPFIASSYAFEVVLLPVLVFALAALGLNVLTGYAGQISLGTGGFMAVGAYSCYKLAGFLPEVNIIIIILISGLFAAGVGVIFGLPSLRIKGFYLAVATLAAQFFLEWLFQTVPWFTDYSSSATIAAPARTLFGYTIMGPGTAAETKYFVALSFFIVFGLIVKNLARGRIGRSWMAIRDFDIAAELIGIRPLRTKLMAFAVSSYIVGVAGALYAFYVLENAEAEAFELLLISFPVLFMIVIGGLGTVMGSILGAGFVILVPILIINIPGTVGIHIPSYVAQHISLMVFGAAIVFFLIVEPNGLARLWQIGKEKLRLWPFPH
jgi:branched-chain amino acid transport system permease protein